MTHSSWERLRKHRLLFEKPPPRAHKNKACVSSCFKDKNHPKTTGTDPEKERDWIIGWKLIVVKSRKTEAIPVNRQLNMQVFSLTRSFFFLSGVMNPFLAFLPAAWGPGGHNLKSIFNFFIS
jgi:hypothetical protein